MVENLEFDNFISSILKKEILHKFSYFRTLQKKKKWDDQEKKPHIAREG